RHAERRERQESLCHAEDLAEQRHPSRGSLSGALEVIVEVGVLELMQVERRRVLHDPNAHAIREQVAEQSLGEAGESGEQLVRDDAPHLEPEQSPYMARRTPPSRASTPT